MQHNGSTPPTIDELRQALHRFCEGKQRMCIPAQESDDDIIIDDAFDELSHLRDEVERLEAMLANLERQHGTFPPGLFEIDLKGL